MRKLFLLPMVLLVGCDIPSLMVPVIGKPHFGNQSTNYYYGEVTQKVTPWEMYFWIAVIVAAVVFTPIGGLLWSKLKKYKNGFIETAKGIEHSKTETLKRELSKRMTDRTKSLVKKLKASGEI